MVKLSALGDVIHTLPSLAALRRCFPTADITWIVEEAASDLLMDHPLLDRVIVSRRKRWLRDLRSGRLRRALQEARLFLGELRARRYDLVIDFHGLFKSAVITALSRASRRLGYDSLQELSGMFYTEKIPEDMGKHAIDRYLDFPRHLGCVTGTPEFIIPVRDEHRMKVESLLDANGIGKEEPLVVVNPIALWETKLWDNEKFARLCERIAAELSAIVVLTGVDGTALEPIRSRMKKPAVNLGGKTTLRDLACLLQTATLLVSTDSGPMHLAAAVGTPVVALFGPTIPARTGPYGEQHVVIRKELSCSPCLRKQCRTKECMASITVEEVFAAVREMFENRSDRRSC